MSSYPARPRRITVKYVWYNQKKPRIVIFRGKNGSFTFCARDKFVATQKLARVLQITLTELMVRESLREVGVREQSNFSEMHWLGLV